MRGITVGKESKIFDPADGFGMLTDVAEVADATIVKRGDRWWTYLAGQRKTKQGTVLFSASLPEGAPLSSDGWALTPDAEDAARAAALAGFEHSKAWDLAGGRHCPSYVRGWDSERRDWVERIYYAGGAKHLWGPYTIGYLEWDGRRWVDQPQPIFAAVEEWERGSVYEPNLIYADGKWKMWYVAGNNRNDYIVQGFAESPNGRTGWSARKVFLPPEEKVFDFCVIPVAGGYEAVFSRIWLGQTPPPLQTGLWWCHSRTASSEMSEWSTPVQIMTAENRGWHSGPWKPSIQYGENDPRRLFVFFNGAYVKGNAGAYAFTVGCLELERLE